MEKQKLFPYHAQKPKPVYPLHILYLCFFVTESVHVRLLGASISLAFPLVRQAVLRHLVWKYMNRIPWFVQMTRPSSMLKVLLFYRPFIPGKRMLLLMYLTRHQQGE